MKLLTVGSIAYDSIETPLESRDRVLGGSATYFCYAASFFAPSRLVGVVGNDFEEKHFQLLRDLNVDLEGLQIEDGKTFEWGCRYEQDMNIRHTKFTNLNVFADFNPTIPDNWKDTEVVFLANIHPALQHAVLDQVNQPAFIAADSMNLWIDTERDSLVKLLARLDALIINDEEVRMLSGENHLPAAVRIIMDMGPKTLIVKRGEYGVAMFSEEGIFFAPGFPVERAIDPTGAGDCFAGGFMGYLTGTGTFDDAALRRAVIHGSAVGGFAVEGFGFDRLVKLQRSEIHERVRHFKRLSAFELDTVE